MKKEILSFAKWAQANWLALVIFMAILMMLFVFAIFFSWLYGYWSNALYGTKFELGSCWTGVSAVITGLGSVIALAKAGWTKYGMDSQYNTPLGEHPAMQQIRNEGIK